MYNGSFTKQNNSMVKYPPPTVKPGIPIYPPNYTKNSAARDSLDTPDPKDERPTVHTQTLSPLRARVQLINEKKSEWYGVMGKGEDIRTFPLGSVMRRTCPYSKTKKLC